MAFGDLVQSKTASGNTGTAITATFDTTPTVGNLIVAAAFHGDGPFDPAGTLVEDVDHADGTQDDAFSLGHRVVQSGDGSTWGFTAPASGQECGVVIFEIEGPWEASPLDQTGTTAFASSQSSQAVTASGATTQNDEVAFAAWGFRVVGDQGTEEPIASSVDNSFTNLTSATFGSADAFNFKGVALAFKVLTATGTPTVTLTYTINTPRSGAIIATFKKAAGGAPIVPQAMLLGVG